MKICLINSLFKPLAIGGAEKICENIATALVDLGHDVKVLTIALQTSERQIDSSYEIIRLANNFIYHRSQANKQSLFKKIIWHWQNIFNRGHVAQVKKIFKNWKPDIVWTHNLSGFGWQVAPFLRQAKIRHWHELHDFQFIDPFGTYYRASKIKARLFTIIFFIYQQLAKKIIGSPELVIGPSRFIVDFHQQRGFFHDSKLTSHVNPLKDDFFSTRPGGFKLPINFLFVGQVEKHKGVALLIEVFNNLIDLPVKLTIIGAGDFLQSAKNINKNQQVNFCGSLSSEKVREKMLLADVLLMPSLWPENSPTVIAESLALGRPVMASNIGGIPEMIIDKKNGWLLTAGKAGVWRDLILDIINNPNQLLSMPSQAQQTAVKFSLEEYKNWLTGLL